jgi:hypothetical protein
MRIDRKNAHLELEFLNVDETRFLQRLSLRVVLDHGEAGPDLFGALDKELSPLPHCRVLFDRVIVAGDNGRSLKSFKPSARTANTKRLSKESVPVFNAANEPPHVDVIGRVGGKGPLASAVFNLTVFSR